MASNRAWRAFEAECRKLIKAWRLDDWAVVVLYEQTQNPDALGSCQVNVVKRWARVKLNPDHAKTMSPAFARSVAKHEMIHVLLGEMSCLMGARFVTSDETEAAEERLVQKLMGII